MSKNLTEIMEEQEQIQKLIDNGFGEIVEAMLDNETKVYTKKGRLNKSGACRVLGWKTKQLEEALRACKEILNDDPEEEE